MRRRVIIGMTLCAFLITASGAWAASSWNSTTGKLVIDDTLPLMYKGSDPDESLDNIGGLEQLLSGDRYYPTPRSEDVIPSNFGTTPLTAVKELIITPNAAPGGTEDGPGSLRWEDWYYIRHMTGIVSIDCTGAKTLPNGIIWPNSGLLLSSLQFLALPDNIETISNDAFAGATSLHTIILPESMSGANGGVISADAFPSTLTNLKTIVFKGATPPQMSLNTFGNASTTTFVVPKNADPLYRAALLQVGVSPTVIKYTDVVSMDVTPTNLDSGGGNVKVRVGGDDLDLTGQTITVVGGTSPVTAEIVSGKLASADVAIPANNGTSVVSHTLTVYLNDVSTGKTATVAVSPAGSSTTYNPLTGVTLKSSTLLTKGSTDTLTATLVPVDTTSTDLRWESSKETVVTVVPSATNPRSATITAHAVGSADITVAYPDTNISATCTVYVTVEPVSIKFEPLNQTQTVAVGKDVTLKWTLTPPDASSDVTLESYHPTVASVTWTTATTATVTGLSEGTATIKATTSNEKVAFCFIKVTSDGSPGTGDLIVMPSEEGPYRVGSPFNIEVSLSETPTSVSIDILRPDGYIDSRTAKRDGLTAWISYTPPLEGTYIVTVTAVTASGTDKGTWEFVVGRNSGGGGSGGGCNAGVGLLLGLVLVPAIKKTRSK
jgi:Synergist-CTERM protein sorting domain-containing protein